MRPPRFFALGGHPVGGGAVDERSLPGVRIGSKRFDGDTSLKLWVNQARIPGDIERVDLLDEEVLVVEPFLRFALCNGGFEPQTLSAGRRRRDLIRRGERGLRERTRRHACRTRYH